MMAFKVLVEVFGWSTTTGSMVVNPDNQDEGQLCHLLGAVLAQAEVSVYDLVPHRAARPHLLHELWNLHAGSEQLDSLVEVQIDGQVRYDRDVLPQLALEYDLGYVPGGRLAWIVKKFDDVKDGETCIASYSR
jgi:hypothetical protein